MIDFSLTDEQKMLQEVAHDFAEKEIRPVAVEVDRNPDPVNAFPREVVKKGLQLGFGKLLVPEKYGGHGASLLDYAILAEELGWGDAGIASTFLTSIFLTRLLNFAPEGQKGKWLRAICEDKNGTFLMAGAYTEPSGGSEILCPLPDPSLGVRTTAVRNGDGYVINGTKCFAENAGVAKLYFVLTRSDKTKPNFEGLSIFLVPADTEGLKFGTVEDKMGHRGCRNQEVIFENMWVPEEYLLGEEGRGAEVMEETFRGEAVGTGSMTVGIARAAYEVALKYAKERVIWGQQIKGYESISDKLVEMRMKIEASRAFIWKLAWAVEHPELGNGLDRLHQMAKVFPTGLIRQITIDAMQILGGYGYMKDFPIEKYVRDAMVLPIVDTTNEVLKIFLAEEL
jgi:acyl-CoA dehydrogenase